MTVRDGMEFQTREAPLFPLRLQPCLVRPLINRRAVLVLAKCETDKAEHHQGGSGYHQPMRILHRGEHGLFPLRLQPDLDKLAAGFAINCISSPISAFMTVSSVGLISPLNIL